MRYQISRPILALIFFASAGTVAAQDGPDDKMPCPQVIKLGLRKFLIADGEKRQDYSTYGQKLALNYYVDCRRPDNDKLALKLPALRLKQVNLAREQLAKMGSASWSNAYIAAGGGTMYGLASTGAYADREDFVTELIKSLAVPSRTHPAARRRANQFVTRTGRELPNAGPPDLQYWEAESRPEQLKRYQSNAKEIRDAFAQLDSLIRVLPDKPAELLARRMERELIVGFEE